MVDKNVSSIDQGDDAEFARLFWAARKACRVNTGTLENGPEYQAAVAFARSHGWKWAEALLEATRLTFTDAIDEAAIRRLNECEQTTPESLRGIFDFVHGSALGIHGDYDDAIVAYRRVLEDPHFESPGMVWNNLGNVLNAKGEHEEATKAYQKALEAPPGFETI